MVYDRLAADRPLLVTRPADPRASIDTHGYLSACEWLDAAHAGQILSEADRVLSDVEAAARLKEWVRHYFGDTTPGAATARFHAAIEQLMQEWDRWQALTAGDPVDDDQDDAELDDAD